MPKYYHDTQQVEKDWWLQLSPVFKSLLFWIEKKHSTAGIYDVNLFKFCMEWYHMEVKPEDIDLDEFIRQCNIDGKVRMMKIADGKKLFYTTTIKFQGSNVNVDHIDIVNNFKYRGVIVQLSGFPETYQWTLEQVRKKTFRVNTNLITTLVKSAGESIPDSAKQLCIEIARIQKNEIYAPEGSENDRIKQRDNNTCQYCGKHEENPSNLEIDHIRPRSKGGDELSDNKVSACTSCNNIKADNDVFEFLRETGLDPMEATKDRIRSLIKRKHLHYPKDYPLDIDIKIDTVSNTSKNSIPLKVYNKSASKKFPNRYDPRFEAKLGGNDIMKYHGHLKSLGWEKVVAPGGTVWNEPKKTA